LRAGVGGSGFWWVFMVVCRKEKTVTRAEASNFLDFFVSFFGQAKNEKY
jgi:hypothetical protein